MPPKPTHPKIDELRIKGIVKDITFNPFTEYYQKLLNLALLRRYPAYDKPEIHVIKKYIRRVGYRQIGKEIDPMERIKDLYNRFHAITKMFVDSGVLDTATLKEIYDAHNALELDMNEFVLWRLLGKNLKEKGLRGAWRKNIDGLAEDIRKAEEEYELFQEAHEMLGAGVGVLLNAVIKKVYNERPGGKLHFKKAGIKDGILFVGSDEILEELAKKAKERLKRVMGKNKIAIDLENADPRSVAKTLTRELERLKKVIEKHA